MWIVTWHPGDGDHAYTDLQKAISALRYQPYRDATLTFFQNGKVVQSMSFPAIKGGA